MTKKKKRENGKGTSLHVSDLLSERLHARSEPSADGGFANFLYTDPTTQGLSLTLYYPFIYIFTCRQVRGRNGSLIANGRSSFRIAGGPRLRGFHPQFLRSPPKIVSFDLPQRSSSLSISPKDRFFRSDQRSTKSANTFLHGDRRAHPRPPRNSAKELRRTGESQLALDSQKKTRPACGTLRTWRRLSKRRSGGPSRSRATAQQRSKKI